jgi:hypothetical protein
VSATCVCNPSIFEWRRASSVERRAKEPRLPSEKRREQHGIAIALYPARDGVTESPELFPLFFIGASGRCCCGRLSPLFLLSPILIWSRLCKQAGSVLALVPVLVLVLVHTVVITSLADIMGIRSQVE